MQTITLLDNDLALKISAFACANDLMNCLRASGSTPAVLGISPHVTMAIMQTRLKLQFNHQALNELRHLLSAAIKLEPTEEEIALAAQLEEAASCTLGVLDSGESLLCAVLIHRNAACLLTGDKRAILALEHVAKNRLADRIGCLEQVFEKILEVITLEVIRRRVCNEPGIDRSLSICFQCSTQTVQISSVRSGLRSYIQDLRRGAPTVLIEALADRLTKAS